MKTTMLFHTLLLHLSMIVTLFYIMLLGYLTEERQEQIFTILENVLTFLKLLLLN